MRVTIDPLQTGSGIEVVDPIERHRCSLVTAETVTPKQISTKPFFFPVDTAASITTSQIRLPLVVAVCVRTTAGEVVAEAEHFADEELPAGTYTIELCTPVKVYLRVESSVRIISDTEQMTLEFGEAVDIHVGARSHHKHPAATITTTADPEDMMAAVSMFGSALKTTTPERSYPSLRGHPPTIELGDELSIPDNLVRPDTGVEIQIPSTYRAVFVTAPLAYYLGARVVPGETPTLVTDTGFEHRLDSPRGFEKEVERVLKQTFFLDCLTRTHGYYPVDLHERNELEPHIDLDFATLYDQSLGEQLEAYLSVPFELLEAYIPSWKLTTHIVPTPNSVETLPFVVNDLAVIRTPHTQELTSSALTAAVDDFFRDDEFTRSTADATHPEVSYVQPERTNSLEQAWVGDETPVGASKLTREAFQNRLERTPTHGDITITVICNDSQMGEEQAFVDDVYGSRAELPFDVDVLHNLSTEELRQVLRAQTDFLHYIGHIDADGFQCSDGKLDLAELKTTGVDAFLLNACQSYEQGTHLIDAGAIGGVVTLSDVINSGAVRVGQTMARLLNSGFPLQAALTIAREESLVGGQYIVIGDGGLAVTQAKSGTPNLCEIESSEDEFIVEHKTYPTTQRGMGSLVMPYIGGNANYVLSSGRKTFHLSRQELIEFLQLEDVPVRINGNLQWSNQISRDDL